MVRKFPVLPANLRLRVTYALLLLLSLLLVFSSGCGGSSSGGSGISAPAPTASPATSDLGQVETFFRSYYFESAYLLSSSSYSTIKDYVNAYRVVSKDIYTRYYNEEDLTAILTTLSTNETLFYHLYGSVGYISFDRFVEGTARRVAEKVTTLENGGATSLILDLRVNGGGLPGECNKLVDFFTATSPPTTIVYSTNSSGAINGMNADFTLGDSGNRMGHETRFNASNMVILTSALTGSASEIFLAALKSFGEARQIGSVTFGKSRMVLFNPLPTGDGYEITVARILHADVVDREGVGLSPDIDTTDPFSEAYSRLSGSTSGIPRDPLIDDFNGVTSYLSLLYDQAYWRDEYFQSAYKALFLDAKILSPRSMCEIYSPSVRR